MKGKFDKKEFVQNYNKALKELSKHKNILFLTTSNRWQGDSEIPKSSLIALDFASKLEKENSIKVKTIDVSKLKIFVCEGNISTANGNLCGLKKAKLLDDKKNPTGQHRCWASINNKSDELWKISKAIFESDCVVFFTSVRWGQTNSLYQKLIERLTWLENRHTTLGEENILEDISCGIVVMGQNWQGEEVLRRQKQVLKYVGFNMKSNLCFNVEFTNSDDERNESYKKSKKVFDKAISLV